MRRLNILCMFNLHPVLRGIPVNSENIRNNDLFEVIILLSHSEELLSTKKYPPLRGQLT